jgi:ParB/RepB/Spo0J family partition protein
MSRQEPLFEIDWHGRYRGRLMSRVALNPECVTIPQSRLRAEINEEKVAGLMESISSIGLQTIIVVRKVTPRSSDYVLVIGRHRLEACKRLGIKHLHFDLFDGDEIEARMWEISENLHRSELTALEHDLHLAEWIRLKGEKLKAQLAPSREHTGGRPNQGINEAVRVWRRSYPCTACRESSGPIRRSSDHSARTRTG